MEFDEFEAVYDKFIEEELPNLEYPDVSAYEFFKGGNHSPFWDVISFFRSKEVPYADRLDGNDSVEEVIANRKGYNFDREPENMEQKIKYHYKNTYDYHQDLWNRLREIYNRNIAEAELVKEKYLAALSEKYFEYFDLAQWICGALFDTKAGKEYFESEKDEFIRIVISVLAGQYEALTYIKDNREIFEPLLNTEIENYLIPETINTITGERKKELSDHLKGKDLFFERLGFLLSNYIRIKETERIVYTFYEFESIALHEAANEPPPVKIPTYEEEKNRNSNRDNPRNSGRKYDESAPQKPIAFKVEELANKDKFQDSDGNAKPTSIRDEIAENFPELMGDIKERALFTRVKKALSMFNVDEDGNYKRVPF